MEGGEGVCVDTIGKGVGVKVGILFSRSNCSRKMSATTGIWVTAVGVWESTRVEIQAVNKLESSRHTTMIFTLKANSEK
jgi:hypothetical protein